MKYLHKFNSAAEFEAAYNGNDYIEPWVSLTIDAVNDVNKVDYNKQPVDWDFELVWHSIDTCGYQELTNFSSRVGFEEVDSSIGHWYHITGQAFTTNPISSFKVKISNCPGYDGIYTVTGDNSGQGTNYWWWTGPEGSFSLQVTVEQNNNVAKLYADFTEGC